MIATTKEQSARLTACGVDPKTADMFYTTNPYKPNKYPNIGKIGTRKDLIPAWSLSALMEILPRNIDGAWLTIQKTNCKKGTWGIAYMKCDWDDKDDEYNFHTHSEGTRIAILTNDLIDGLVELIEWLTYNDYSLNIPKQ